MELTDEVLKSMEVGMAFRDYVSISFDEFSSSFFHEFHLISHVGFFHLALFL